MQLHLRSRQGSPWRVLTLRFLHEVLFSYRFYDVRLVDPPLGGEIEDPGCFGEESV